MRRAPVQPLIRLFPGIFGVSIAEVGCPPSFHRSSIWLRNPARPFLHGYVSIVTSQINGVRMSPQIEPLLLDDTLKVVLDLQEQWRNAGWVPIRVKDFPPFADTPQWRAQLRDENKGGTSYWHAGTQYQVMLVVNRFTDYRHPTEERYLITLSLATPWTNP